MTIEGLAVFRAPADAAVHAADRWRHDAAAADVCARRVGRHPALAQAEAGRRQGLLPGRTGGHDVRFCAPASIIFKKFLDTSSCGTFFLFFFFFLALQVDSMETSVGRWQVGCGGLC